MMSFQHHLMSGPEEQIPAMNRVKQIIKEHDILTICGDITVGIHHTPEGRDYESGGKRLNPLMHGRLYRPKTEVLQVAINLIFDFFSSWGHL